MTLCIISGTMASRLRACSINRFCQLSGGAGLPIIKIKYCIAGILIGKIC
jgi:hypothetical protein